MQWDTCVRTAWWEHPWMYDTTASCYVTSLHYVRSYGMMATSPRIWDPCQLLSDLPPMGHLRSHGMMGTSLRIWDHCQLLSDLPPMGHLRSHGWGYETTASCKVTSLQWDTYVRTAEDMRPLPVAKWPPSNGTLTFARHDGNIPEDMRPLPVAKWPPSNGTLTFARHDGNIPEGMRPLPVACWPTLFVITGF